MPPKLAFEYVALRDIEPGEEIFLSYGSDWDEEWSDYEIEFNKNIMPTRSKSYVTAHELNKNFAQAPVPTEEEQGQYLRIPDHVQIRCHLDVLQGNSLSNYEWNSNDYGLRCNVVDRFLESGDILYTVDVEVDMENRQTDADSVMHILRTDVPRRELRFFDVPGTSDLFMESNFREPIELPEDLLPEHWINRLGS
jgi:hypothetical protein